jgi:hypothetical protein
MTATIATMSSNAASWHDPLLPPADAGCDEAQPVRNGQIRLVAETYRGTTVQGAVAAASRGPSLMLVHVRRELTFVGWTLALIRRGAFPH